MEKIMKKTHLEIKEIENLHRMRKEDIDKFSECAALAYKEYPLFKYLTNNKVKHEVVKNILYASILSMKDNAIGISTEEDANAIAIFAPPNYKGSNPFAFIFGGGFKLLYLSPLSIFYRLAKYENHAMKIKKKYTKHNCWYLYNLTVKPEYQHQGMSSKILIPMLEYLDRIKEDCYLETHKEENVQIYEHYGFELLEVSKMPNTEIVQYSMLRKHKN